MKMSGEETIPASRETVWRALNDPAILRQSIPGCESIAKHSDTELEARVVVKLGPLKARFAGIVNLTDLDPPNGYRISGEGKGGLAGSASGGANVKLEAVPEGTKLSYDVDAQVTGKLASLGARFIDPTARALAGKFFAKFAALAAKLEPAAAKPKPRKPAKKPVKKPATKPARKPAKKPAKKKR
ncbi:MAG: SRPBCC family protein [Hyphomicrobiales bacterium]